MTRTRWILVAAGVGLLLLAGTSLGAGLGAPKMMTPTLQAQSATQLVSYRQFRGRITSVNRGGRWFSMHTNKSGLVHMGIANGTRWYGCSWGAMRVGRHVYVHAYRHNGYWMAMSVRRWQGNWDDHWGHMGDHMGYMMGW